MCAGVLKNADKETVMERVAHGAVLLPTGTGEETEAVPVNVFVSSFSMSYLYFHLVTAYNILGCGIGQGGLYGGV